MCGAGRAMADFLAVVGGAGYSTVAAIAPAPAALGRRSRDPARRGCSARGEGLAQRVEAQLGAVRRLVAVEALALGERTGVDDVEAEGLDQVGDDLLGVGVVAGDREGASVVGAGRDGPP